MADVFRGPLYVARREFPPPLSLTSIVFQTLLTTTLAVVAATLPVGKSSATVLVDDTQKLSLNASTSAGMPKTLYADKQAPVFNVQQPAVAPHRPLEWLNASTASGTPKTLTFDRQLPFFNPAWVPPNAEPKANWLPANTTRGQSITLQVIIPPMPAGLVAPHYAPQRFWWQPPDDSQGTPKTLYGDAQLPVLNAIYNAPDLVRSVVNTSQGTTALLLPVPVTPLPPGESSWVGLQKAQWQPADTSQSAYGLTHVTLVVVTPTPGSKTITGYAPTIVQPGSKPTWGTFPRWPEWWPSKRKKIEEDFAEAVAEIVAPLPDKSAEVVRELSRQLVSDRIEVDQLRRLVKAQLAREKQTYTAKAKTAVDKVEAAGKAALVKREALAQLADEEMQSAERKKRRNRDAIKILGMLS
jgi:hypothetical protein